MEARRHVVVGDVHGCLDEFRALMNLVEFRPTQDRLGVLGDLLDRGPDPVGCVRFARELRAVGVMGNHEEKNLRWNKHVAAQALTGKKNPMRAFPAVQAACNAALTEDDLAFLRGLPHVLEVVPGLLAVHAGMEPAFNADNQTDAVLRVRYVNEAGRMVGFAKGCVDQPADTVDWFEQWNGPESVVFGHAVHGMREPLVREFEGGAVFGLDTGCVFGGRLTAMVVQPVGVGWKHEFVQVDAVRAYFAKGGDHE